MDGLTMKQAQRIAKAWATEAHAPAYIVKAAGRLHVTMNLEQMIRSYGDKFGDMVWSTD